MFMRNFAMNVESLRFDLLAELMVISAEARYRGSDGVEFVMGKLTV